MPLERQGHCMINQNGGQSGEAESKPGLVAENLSGRTRTAPVIEGEAVEVSRDGEESTRETAELREAQAEFFSEEQAGLAADAVAPNPTADLQEEQAEAFSEGQAGLDREQAESDETPVAAEPAKTEANGDAPSVAPSAAPGSPRKIGVFGSFAALVGVLVIGGGSFYGWKQMHRPKIEPAQNIAVLPAEKPLVNADEKAAQDVAPAAASHEPAPVAAPTVESTPKPEDKAVMPAHEAEASSPAKETPAPAPAAAEHAESPAAAATPVIAPEALLAPVQARLDRMQETLDRLAQRLQKAEAQLAAPKSDARADIAARDAGPANASEASSRIVAAQSLLTALQQGDDGAAMLAALEASGGNPTRLNSLRAGLAAPTPAQLASEFHSLAPRLLASAEPAAQTEETPHGAAAGLFAFVEARAKKLVRVHPVGAPNEDGMSGAVAHIETALDHGDLAAALKERATLPEPAQAISADWARMAQSRLDAESAARAELTDAFNMLGKRKS
jgi:hypothetical protein